MAWAWVRPRDATILSARPLLDLGTGDGQTLAALAPEGFTVGVDRSFTLLRAGAVNAAAERLPFADGTFGTVLAGDVFHHLADAQLLVVLTEIRRVLRPNGRLIAWWYEETSDRSPDAPRHTRSLEAFAALAEPLGLRLIAIELDTAVDVSPTVGVCATVGP